MANKKKRVILVEKLNKLMAARVEVPHPSKKMILDLLEFNNVEVLTGFDFVGRDNGQGVNLVNSLGLKKRVHADTVIAAQGFKPDRELYDNLRQNTPELYLIGDARIPRNIMGAVWDAYEVCRAI